jgi:LPS-assembly lipoprotein
MSCSDPAGAPAGRRDHTTRPMCIAPARHATSIVRMAIAVVLSCALAACGFHLRGEATYAFASIYVNGAGAPSLAGELKRALAAASSARVVDSAKDAQVILDIPRVTDDKEVLSLTGAGSVREYELTKRVEFRLHDAEGGEWLPPGEITLRRSYSFSESEVLARDAEEQGLLKDMQTDAVQQLVRRLQAARKPA